MWFPDSALKWKITILPNSAPPWEVAESDFFWKAMGISFPTHLIRASESQFKGVLPIPDSKVWIRSGMSWTVAAWDQSQTNYFGRRVFWMDFREELSFEQLLSMIFVNKESSELLILKNVLCQIQNESNCSDLRPSSEKSHRKMDILKRFPGGI